MVYGLSPLFFARAETIQANKYRSVTPLGLQTERRGNLPSASRRLLLQRYIALAIMNYQKNTKAW